MGRRAARVADKFVKPVVVILPFFAMAVAYVMPRQSDHPLIWGVCTAVSFASFAVGIALVMLVTLGSELARKPAAVCGFGIMLPMAAGLGLMYGKHWHFDAMVPMVAVSDDGDTYRDGCRLGADALDEIRAGGYRGFWYRFYVVLIMIPLLGGIDEHIKARDYVRMAAEFQARRPRP
jgi:hypothetical protein